MVWSGGFCQYSWFTSEIREGKLTLSRCSSPAKTLNKRRNEVLHGLRPTDKHEEEGERPDTPVLDRQHKCLPIADALVSALCQTNTIECQAMASQDALLFGEELGSRRRVVGEEEQDNDSCKARDGTFDDLERVSEL